MSRHDQDEGRTIRTHPNTKQTVRQRHRGEYGTLRLFWWQPPTNLNIHRAVGSNNCDAASLVSEPLARISRHAKTPDIPILASVIPSIQNGLLAADYTSVTWRLKEGVVWSDGTPFTAADVAFTWQWIMDPSMGATNTEAYSDIADVQPLSPAIVKIIFKQPVAAWYQPFVGDAGEILPQHALLGGSESNDRFARAPIGTGPYIVEEFASGKGVVYKTNPRFREPDAPHFSIVEMSGDGDAMAAVEAVRTRRADYAWNIQVEPAIVRGLVKAGITVAAEAGPAVEQIIVNMADPNTEVDGELSSPKRSNPVLSDPLVRQALTLAIDREAIAKRLYGPGGIPGNTLLPLVLGDSGKPWRYDPSAARILLDRAGWRARPKEIREKDGTEMHLTLRSSISQVRDRTGQVIASNLRNVGIGVGIRSVDAAVFFGPPENPASVNQCTVDLELVSTGALKPDPQAFLESLTTKQIACRINHWGGRNIGRWSDPEYDALFDRLRRDLNPERRIALSRQLDERVIEAGARIPLVIRNYVSAHRPDLGNIVFSPYSSQLWNIAHWILKR